MIEHYCTVVMLGRATADPVRRGARLNSVVSFGFVVNDRYEFRGEWRDRPMYIDCEATDAMGEIVAKTVRRGYLLMVEGRLRLDEWVDAQQIKHRRHKIAVTAVKVMQRPKERPVPPPPSPAQSSEPEFVEPEPI